MKYVHKFQTGGYNITCRYFYLTETGQEGIGVSVDGEFVGEIFNLLIPDDGESMAEFESEVNDYLEAESAI